MARILFSCNINPHSAGDPQPRRGHPPHAAIGDRGDGAGPCPGSRLRRPRLGGDAPNAQEPRRAIAPGRRRALERGETRRVARAMLLERDRTSALAMSARASSTLGLRGFAMTTITVDNYTDAPVAGEIDLRQAVAEASAGDTIAFPAHPTNSSPIITLDSPLVIAAGMDLTIDGEQGAQYGFGAGGAFSDGGVEINGVVVVDAGAVLTLENGTVADTYHVAAPPAAANGEGGVAGQDGTADGQNGTNGGGGGDGEAGADGQDALGVIQNAGTLTLVDEQVIGTTYASAGANGGAGGDGADGGSGGPGGAGGKGGSGGPGGAGGKGGDAVGGIYNTGALIVENSIVAGAAYAGDGGDGGPGGAGANGGDGGSATSGQGGDGGAAGNGGAIGVSGDGGSAVGSIDNLGSMVLVGVDSIRGMAKAGAGGVAGTPAVGGKGGAGGSPGAPTARTGSPGPSAPMAWRGRPRPISGALRPRTARRRRPRSSTSAARQSSSARMREPGFRRKSIGITRAARPRPPSTGGSSPARSDPACRTFRPRPAAC